MSEEKRLYPDKWWSRQNSGTSTTTDLCFYLEELDELLCNADEVLSGTDIPKTGYISQTEKIYRLTDQVGGFFQYVSSLPNDIDSIIEEPLYYGFNKGATENLSRVHLEDIQTENTLGIGEEYTISARGYNYSNWRTKEYLTIADFMGNTTPEEANPYDGIISAEYVEEFARLFEEDYNNMQGCFEEGTTFDDYVRYLIGMGEFDHKMDQPFLQFLNGLTDLLIITAIIESVTGKELITGEDLTDLERGMKCVGAIVDAVSIGTAILTGGGSITLKSVLRVWISELVTDASTYTVGYVGEQLGLPPAVTLILSLGVGSFVGYKMGKWAVEGIDGKVYTSGGNESGSKTLLQSTPEEIANMTRKELQHSEWTG